MGLLIVIILLLGAATICLLEVLIDDVSAT
jgi:hypothetical protein